MTSIDMVKNIYKWPVDRKLTYRVRMINPDRFWRPVGGKCEGKIRQIFLPIIYYLLLVKKKIFFFFFLVFKFFFFLNLNVSTFWRCAGIGGHRTKFKAIKGHLKIRWLQNQFWVSWFAKLQFIGLKTLGELGI